MVESNEYCTQLNVLQLETKLHAGQFVLVALRHPTNGVQELTVVQLTKHAGAGSARDHRRTERRCDGVSSIFSPPPLCAASGICQTAHGNVSLPGNGQGTTRQTDSCVEVRPTTVDVATNRPLKRTSCSSGLYRVFIRTTLYVGTRRNWVLQSSCLVKSCSQCCICRLGSPF